MNSVKRYILALAAVALIVGAPLIAQEAYEPAEPTETELQQQETMETEAETDVDLDADVDVDAELQDDVDDDVDLDADVDADLNDDEWDDTDELPATGSELPLAALLGVSLLTGAAILRARS